MSENLNVNIRDLLPVAQSYALNNSHVDKDQSRTINSEEELNVLLAGTGANSIEDLISTSIHEKINQNDTNKIFTAFMTTENAEQAQENKKAIDDISKQLSYQYYYKMKTLCSDIESTSTEVKTIIEGLQEQLKYKNSLSEDEVIDLVSQVNQIKSKISRLLKPLSSLDDAKFGYKRLAGEEFKPLITKGEQLSSLAETIKNQCLALFEIYKDGGIVGTLPENKTMTGIKSQLNVAINDASSLYGDAWALRQQLETQEETDMKLLSQLSKHQEEFTSDGIASEEEQEQSKQLLSELVDFASPLARNLVIKAAENANSSTTVIDSPKVEINGKEYEVGKKYQEQGPDGKPRIVSYDRLGNKWDISHGGVKVND